MPSAVPQAGTRSRRTCGDPQCGICNPWPGGIDYWANRAALDELENGPLFDAERTVAPNNRFSWEDPDPAGLYGFDMAGFTPPKPTDAFPTLIANMAAIGQQREREVFCQPLLSA